MVSLSSSVLVLLWDPPPSELVSGLQLYQIERTDVATQESQVFSHTNLNVRQLVSTGLDQGATYKFAVRGIYSGGVMGVDFVVTGMTRSEGKLEGGGIAVGGREGRNSCNITNVRLFSSNWSTKKCLRATTGGRSECLVAGKSSLRHSTD